MADATNIKLTKDYFQQSGYETLIAKSPEKNLLRYSGIFFAEANVANKNGDIQRESLFRLLGDITGMALRSEDIEHPLHSMIVDMDGRRSAIPEDFTDDELNFVEEILAVVMGTQKKLSVRGNGN